MIKHDFIEYAKTLPIEEIDSFISELNRVKEERIYETRYAAAQKVKDTISEYLKLGGRISIEGEVWNEEWTCNENVEGTFQGCFEKDGYLTFTFTE